MTSMKSVNKSCSRRTALGACQTLLYKLLTGEICVAVLNFSALMGSATNGRPILRKIESVLEVLA